LIVPSCVVRIKNTSFLKHDFQPGSADSWSPLPQILISVRFLFKPLDVIDN
jgi:hypothetical protein